MMRKLIIGCGYLGLRVARAWLAEGHEVTALTRSPERAAELEKRGLRTVCGDVTEPASLVSLPACETLLYAVGLDRRSGHSQRTVYVDGLENVLRQMRGRFGQLIYISSTSVYGQSAGEWIDETSPTMPARENGCVCLDAERTVWKFFEPRADDSGTSDSTGAAKAHVLRLSGIYGPGRLLSRVEGLRQGTPLGGNPQAFLNLIHVEDAVRAVLACEERGGASSTWLVSDNEPVVRQAYYARLAELVGAPPPRFAPEESALSDFGKRCSNRKLRDELQWTPRYPSYEAGLPAALEETVG